MADGVKFPHGWVGVELSHGRFGVELPMAGGVELLVFDEIAYWEVLKMLMERPVPSSSLECFPNLHHFRSGLATCVSRSCVYLIYPSP